MSDAFRVELRTLDGGPTAVASVGQLSVIADRPIPAGGRGLGFNGGQLLYSAIAVCISNDLYREAAALGLRLSRVNLVVDGDWPGRGLPSGPITVDIELEGDGREAQLAELVRIVEDVAEIPNTIRATAPVEFRVGHVVGSDTVTNVGGGSG